MADRRGARGDGGSRGRRRRRCRGGWGSGDPISATPGGWFQSPPDCPPRAGSRSTHGPWRSYRGAFLQGEAESRALAGDRLDPDAAVMALDDFLDDGEAGAGAAPELVAPVQPLEDAEDGVEVLGRDADAVVAHVEDRRRGGRRVAGHRPGGRSTSRSRAIS